MNLHRFSMWIESMEEIMVSSNRIAGNIIWSPMEKGKFIDTPREN